jgi:type IV pilus assembly protein PilY1
LKNSATGSAYNVNDRFYMIKDTGTSLSTPVTTNVTTSTLFNATTVNYDNTLDGFYINFATGEKGVNAPLADSGFIFFATNKPVDASATSCIGNLGEARAYAVSPFSGSQTSNVLSGGGLAPTAVAGVITLTTTNADGTTTNSNERFCIGCGVSNPGGGSSGNGADGNGSPSNGGGNGGGGGLGTADCTSSLGVCTPTQSVAKKLKRTYWYKK